MSVNDWTHVPTCATKEMLDVGRLYSEQAGEVWTAMMAVKPEPDDRTLDDIAVDRFAFALKAKLKESRAKGRGGWQTCPPEELSRMLREHVEKGDPRDVANFCMFLWSLGHGIATQPTQGEAPSEREALDVDDLCGMLSAASVDFANGDYGQGQYKIGEAIRYARAALATQQAVQAEPVAFEFYNPTTDHAIVDYSRQTHVGPLTKEMGYEARPLGYINPPPAAMKPGDPVPLWQALEALDSLEESSRGDSPYNHFAAGLVRSALEQAATPPAPGQVERGRWLCLTCKSDTPGRHGLMDDRVTPCPNGTLSSEGGA